VKIKGFFAAFLFILACAYFWAVGFQVSENQPDVKLETSQTAAALFSDESVAGFQLAEKCLTTDFAKYKNSSDLFLVELSKQAYTRTIESDKRLSQAAKDKFGNDLGLQRFYKNIQQRHLLQETKYNISFDNNDSFKTLSSTQLSKIDTNLDSGKLNLFRGELEKLHTEFTDNIPFANKQQSLLLHVLTRTSLQNREAFVALYYELGFQITLWHLAEATAMGLDVNTLQAMLIRTDDDTSQPYHFTSKYRSMNLALHAALVDNWDAVFFWLDKNVSPYSNLIIGSPLDVLAISVTNQAEKYKMYIEELVKKGVLPVHQASIDTVNATPYSSGMIPNKLFSGWVTQFELNELEKSKQLFIKEVFSLLELKEYTVAIDCHAEDFEALRMHLASIENDALDETVSLLLLGQEEAKNMYQVFLQDKIYWADALNELAKKDLFTAKIAMDNIMDQIDLSAIQAKSTINQLTPDDLRIYSQMTDNSEKSWAEQKTIIDNIDNPNKQILLALLLDQVIKTNQSGDIVQGIILEGAIVTFEHIKSALLLDNVTALRVLLQYASASETSEKTGRNALWYAVMMKAQACFDLLLKLNVNIESPTLGGSDALDVALQKIFQGDELTYFADALLLHGKKIENSHLQLLNALLVKKPEFAVSFISKHDISFSKPPG